MCWALLGGTLSVHIIPFLTDMGIDEITAANMWALQVFFMIPFRFIGGIISDRLKLKHLPYALALSHLLTALAIVPFLLHQTIPMIYVFLVLYGIGNGLPTTLRIAVISHYFGRKSYGKIYGTMNFFTAALGFIAPIYAGWMYDRTHSYITTYWQGVILALIGVVLTIFIRLPKPTEENQAYIAK